MHRCRTESWWVLKYCNWYMYMYMYLCKHVFCLAVSVVFFKRAIPLLNFIFPVKQTIIGSEGGSVWNQCCDWLLLDFFSHDAQASLDSLMATLTATAPHYIRCIKPNLACKPDVFDSGHVVSQLRASGVLETIAISAKGFPARFVNWIAGCWKSLSSSYFCKSSISKFLFRHL